MKEDNPQFVFFGTPNIAVYILDELEKNNIIPSLVITAPDRKQGRGMDLTSPDVKIWAEKRDIEVWQPDKISDELISRLKERRFPLSVVAAYGKIIPKELINIFPKGILNVHPSLLPKYRGASPIRSQILADEKDIGVTIMLMDELLDHGPILTQKHVKIKDWPIKGRDLDHILAREGGKLLSQTIKDWVVGEISPEEQDHDKATHTRKIKKADGLISLEDDPHTNLLKIHAYDGWPRAHFYEKDKRIIITDAILKNGKLEVLSVIPEGKKEVSYKDYKSLS